MYNKKLSLSIIEGISKALGDTSSGFTGTEIGQLLSECDINDLNPMNTKWRRLKEALSAQQQQDNCSNNILKLIVYSLEPPRHINNQDRFYFLKDEINKILAFEGFQISENGELRKTSKSKTINEAQERIARLKEKLKNRNTHNEIFKFCNEEILSENYFHLVFEATKSIAQRIRTLTNQTLDGSPLIDETFSFKNKIPKLALNMLETESEKSEQSGFMNLLKGIFGMFRNTTAHTPKIIWDIKEEEALDILSLISLVHKRLDSVHVIAPYKTTVL